MFFKRLFYACTGAKGPEDETIRAQDLGVRVGDSGFRLS